MAPGSRAGGRGSTADTGTRPIPSTPPGPRKSGATRGHAYAPSCGRANLQLTRARGRFGHGCRTVCPCHSSPFHLTVTSAACWGFLLQFLAGILVPCEFYWALPVASTGHSSKAQALHGGNGMHSLTVPQQCRRTRPHQSQTQWLLLCLYKRGEFRKALHTVILLEGLHTTTSKALVCTYHQGSK